MTAAKKAVASQSSEENPNLSGYVVTGPCIQVTVGSQVLQFGHGDALPKGIDDGTLKRLTDRGLIEKR